MSEHFGCGAKWSQMVAPLFLSLEADMGDHFGSGGRFLSKQTSDHFDLF